jgi:hypothetical protein
MFFQNFKYTLKALLRNKGLVFWTLAFPLIMALFFNMAFSSIESSESFDAVKVAVVTNEYFEGNETLKKTFETLSNENSDDQVFDTKYVSEDEAKSLLNKGINAFFSFGKAILNNNKNAINCVKFLPLNVILFETDAPYQTLKNEEFTSVRDICRIYEQGYLLREYSVCDVDAQIEFSEVIRNNFLTMFNL